MGLITDARSSMSPLSAHIVYYSGYVSALCLSLGLGFLFLMPHSEFSHRTYFSENALLPGLVKADFHEDLAAEIYLEGLREEAKRYSNGVPFPWLEAQLKQLRLEVYMHNFTLNYPFGSRQFHGQNMYAILRAPRASSTESLVLSAPYRPPFSMEPATDVSIALLLASAKFFRDQNYWAKDIIFLITEHEQLGMQAWLEAYHQTTSGTPGILDHGDLEARAGSIQAAVNLEFSKEAVTHVNVKVQGLNGQLPNMDLFNLINRLCMRDGVGQMFLGREDPHRNDYSAALSTLSRMMLSQASGVPDGNHGLFHRMGIEAVTLEGVDLNTVRSRALLSTSVKRKKKQPPSKRYHEADLYQLGRIIEGTFRSLNNLLERFHQSFFYYVLPGTSSYVSIGMYMPGFGLVAASLVVSALSLWLRCLFPKDDHESMPFAPLPDVLGGALPLMLFYHAVGLVVFYMPHPASRANLLDVHNEDFIALSVVVLSAVAALFPFAGGSLTTVRESTFPIVKCVVLLEIAALGFAVALCNFSLSYFVTGFVVAPLALAVAPTKGKPAKRVAMSLLMALGHPLTLLLTVCVVDAFRIGDDEADAFALMGNGLSAAKHALMFSITDGYIYGNVSYSLGCVFFMPCWSLLWAIVHAQ